MRIKANSGSTRILFLGLISFPPAAKADVQRDVDRLIGGTPTISAPTNSRSKEGLPLLGLIADMGLPDGVMASLTVRPWSFARMSLGAGKNGISYGYRAGITLLPFGQGPTASVEYGRYQEGDANGLVARFIGGSSSAVLEKIGYQFVNVHLGLDFGFRRLVFFVHGGISKTWGHIYNLNRLIPPASTDPKKGTSGVEVASLKPADAMLMGPSVKLGLIAYVW